MSGIEVRAFRRSDREQVTQLVNAHAAVVIPGAMASVNGVLGQFERDPGEFIVDPWVAERHALVAEQAGSVVDVDQAHRRRGIGTWLLLNAAHWLRLGHVDRLLHYAAAGDTAQLAFAEHLGFTELTRTRRGWQRSP